MEGTMFKRIIAIAFIIFFLCGCGRAKEPAAIKIGNVSASASDFERAFKESPYSAVNTVESRREFLDNYITRMLILKGAVEKGLDKDEEFLKNVESFWQQSLIKIMLDRKIKELSKNVEVSDIEIKDYYEAHKSTEFKDKGLQFVYEDIKWKILNNKQQEPVNAWLNSLKKSSEIDIDYNLLKIKK